MIRIDIQSGKGIKKIHFEDRPGYRIIGVMLAILPVPWIFIIFNDISHRIISIPIVIISLIIFQILYFHMNRYYFIKYESPVLLYYYFIGYLLLKIISLSLLDRLSDLTSSSGWQSIIIAGKIHYV